MSQASDVYLAPVRGDDNIITVVNSRIDLILRPGSELAKVWKDVHSCIMACKQSRVPFPVLYSAWTFATTLTGSVSPAPELGHRRLSGSDRSREWRNAWMRLPSLTVASSALRIPLKVERIISPDPVFDAAHYWLDWNSGSRGALRPY